MSAMPQGLAGLGAPSPEELLGQIKDLLDQYLALGDNTPVAGEAQQLSQAIDQVVGGAATARGDLGAPPSDAGGVQPMAGTDSSGAQPVVPPENSFGGNGEEPPPNTKAKTYNQANGSALDRLQKRNKKQGR